LCPLESEKIQATPTKQDLGSTTGFFSKIMSDSCSLPFHVSLHGRHSHTRPTKFSCEKEFFAFGPRKKWGESKKGGRVGVGEGKEGNSLINLPPSFFSRPIFAQIECEKLLRAPEFCSPHTGTLATGMQAILFAGYFRLFEAHNKIQ